MYKISEESLIIEKLTYDVSYLMENQLDNMMVAVASQTSLFVPDEINDQVVPQITTELVFDVESNVILSIRFKHRVLSGDISSSMSETIVKDTVEKLIFPTLYKEIKNKFDNIIKEFGFINLDLPPYEFVFERK